MCSVSGCHGIHYGMCCLYDWIFTGVLCVVCLVVMVFITVCAPGLIDFDIDRC